MLGRSALLLVYTAYFDESGTHDESPVTIMGGLLAQRKECKSFEQDFERIRKKHGFRVFHTKKFKRRKGDFKGWNNEQCMALVADLGGLTSGAFTDSVAVTLRDSDYDQYYRSGDKPNRMRLDSKYGLCFRMALYHFMTVVAKRRLRGRFPELHLVLESGHVNAGDAKRIFDEVKKEFSDAGCDMLKTIVEGKKDKCGQLMMADFIAHSTFMIQTGARPEPLALPHSIKLPKKVGSVLHLESTPEGLKNMRSFLIDAFGKGSSRDLDSAK